MKFYYNGKLMRTSKTREYHFAVLNTNGTCNSCHSTREAAEKEWRRPIAAHETAIEEDLQCIKALERGKDHIDLKCRCGWIRVQLKGKDLFGNDRGQVSTWREYIESHKRDIAKLRTREIVELEARA